MTDVNAANLIRLREEVIRAGQGLLRSGLVVGTWGNLSVRVPGSDTFLITPSGKSYLDITPQDLVLMNLAGEIVEGCCKPSSEYHLHLFIYRVRTEIQAVVHTHSIYASAHAVSRVSIPACVEDQAMIIGGELKVANYALPGTAELARNAVDALGERWAVLLANHGMVGAGRSLAEAMLVCRLVEKSAHINIAARLLGQPVELGDEDVKELRNSYLSAYGNEIGRKAD